MTDTVSRFCICSQDGNRMQQFSTTGTPHQMLIQVFIWTTAGWEQIEGGWMWRGAARLRWADLLREGWSRVR